MAEKKQSRKPARQIPVAARRGVHDDLFRVGFDRQLIMAHAPMSTVVKAIQVIRQRHRWRSPIQLVQLRGHDWTIVDEGGRLLAGFADPEGARELSDQLAGEVILFSYEDTSCCRGVWIYDRGEKVLIIDDMDGIRHRTAEFPSELDEFDVKGHLNHYLIAHEAYFPYVYYDQCGEVLRVVVSDVGDEEILAFEQLPGE
jgi:hypothetical protein